MTQPDAQMIRLALFQAAHSPCRSKRGVAIYTDGQGPWPVLLGAGHNGPPRGGECPGRAVCAGTCGQRSVHAEVRAIRNVPGFVPTASELVHVELGTDGEVVACDGPACWQCSREILDAGFIDGVWLYEARPPTVRVPPVNERGEWDDGPHWHRYSAAEFHRVTLQRCGIPTGGGSL